MRDVAGLLVQKREDVLRTLLVFKKGYWFFPSGKREEGESLHETLAREVYEELGLTIGCMPPRVHVGEFPAIGGTVYRFHTFVCRAEHLVGTPQLRIGDSVKDWVWVDMPLELNLTTHARFIIDRFGV
ncbi:MAG: NUDIX hydrolase [Parcubacteria group bacterium]|nr:NUDIX hydrolase [Parcubacteria group bacterium]